MDVSKRFELFFYSNIWKFHRKVNIVYFDFVIIIIIIIIIKDRNKLVSFDRTERKKETDRMKTSVRNREWSISIDRMFAQANRCLRVKALSILTVTSLSPLTAGRTTSLRLVSLPRPATMSETFAPIHFSLSLPRRLASNCLIGFISPLRRPTPFAFLPFSSFRGWTRFTARIHSIFEHWSRVSTFPYDHC